MKIIAVIVTYNRLSLLKKSILAINQQTKKPDEIIVVNNGSNDGTTEWLSTQSYIVYNQENKGGAAGFSFGIEKAYLNGADWIWVMDDDTIAEKEALEKLLSALHKFGNQQENIGFLSSTVLWTDGSLHEMNRLWPVNKNKIPPHLSSLINASPYSLIQWGTFVSMLVSAKAVEKVGLPIKEFFIWCDDVEYSTRISRSGMAGFAVSDSVVIHETPVNHASNILKDAPQNLWKQQYGLRNDLYSKRVHYGQKVFWHVFLRRMLIWPLQIFKKQKKHRWKFIKVIWSSSIEAITFNPTIEKVNKSQRREFELVDRKEL